MKTCRISTTRRAAALLLATVAGTQSMSARDWHVAGNGNDMADGGPAAPLATVGMALGSASAGDRVLLARGSVFREGDLAVAAGIELAAWGDAALPQPVLSGSRAVAGWEPAPGRPGVYRASLPDTTAVRAVYLDGARMVLARYPDTGWLWVDSGSTSYVLKDAALNQRPANRAGLWNGGTVRWRRWSWWFESRRVSSDSGEGQLSLLDHSWGNEGGDPTRTAYYVDNLLGELDAPGEWFWDQAAKLLYLKPPAGVSLDGALVEASVRGKGLVMRGGAVSDVTIRHYNTVAVEINRPAALSGCRLEQIPGNGVTGNWEVQGSRIEGCVFEDIGENGIEWIESYSSAGGTLMAGNEFRRIGMLPGHCGDGPWHASAIIIAVGPGPGKGVRIEQNRFADIGYIGVLLGAQGQVVRRNVLERCMQILNDGAAIYTNCSSSTIEDNIVLDTLGNLESSHPWIPLGHGIWLEFLSRFANSRVTGNTVAGSGGHGLWLPNNYTCAISGNTLFSNRLAALHLGGFDAEGTKGIIQQNHQITGNLLALGAVPWRRTRPENLGLWASRNDACLGFEMYSDRRVDFGTMTGTRFVTTDGRDLVAGGGYVYTIPEWQQQEADWADRAPSVTNGRAYLFVNDTADPAIRALPAGIDWTHLDGAATGGMLALAPFRSAVLLAAAGDTTGLPGWMTATDGFTAGRPASAPALRVESQGGATVLGFDAAPSMIAVEYLLERLPANAWTVEWTPILTVTATPGEPVRHIEHVDHQAGTGGALYRVRVAVP